MLLAIHLAYSSQTIVFGEELSSFPIATNEPLVAPVVVDKVGYLFLIDTGSGFSTIDSFLANQMRLEHDDEPDRRFPFGSGWRKSPALELGGQRLMTPRLATRDLKAMQLGSGRPISGILGMDVLRSFVIELDFEELVWSLRTDHSKRFDKSVTQRLVLSENGCPFVATKLGNTEEWFLIDTGSDRTVSVSAKWFDQMIANRVIYKVYDPSEMLGSSGLRVNSSARGSQIALSAEPVKNIVITRAAENVPHNYFGIGLLSRYHISLDFDKCVMHLTPNKYVNGRDVSDFDEMAIARAADSISVVSVAGNGRAWKFGVRPGDEIVAVDGKAVANIGFYNAVGLLTRPRIAPITVRVRRFSTLCELSFSP